MLDFSEANSQNERSVKFSDLRVGETFVLAHETGNYVDFDQQYVYIKSEKHRALELNEEDLQYIGEQITETTDVIRVQIVVKSVSIIK